MKCPTGKRPFTKREARRTLRKLRRIGVNEIYECHLCHEWHVSSMRTTERAEKIMGERSNIEWTESTWNPTRGCSRVSKGCEHCYAETYANRFKGEGQPFEGLVTDRGTWNGSIMYAKNRLLDPIKWVEPRKIFVGSMSDIFHEGIDEGWLWKIFSVMLAAPQHTYQILTKRPERMLEFMTRFQQEQLFAQAESTKRLVECHRDPATTPDYRHWPPRHIWLGVSVENQETANERIPDLLATPAAVRWISAEPLLGELDLTHIQSKYLDDNIRINVLNGDLIKPEEIRQQVIETIRLGS
jgi:protein gp37